MAKGLDDLGLAVLEHGESVAVEVSDDALLVVDDGGMQRDLLDLGMENESARLDARFLALGGGSRRRGLGLAGSGLGASAEDRS
jgi:hypothetical protein